MLNIKKYEHVDYSNLLAELSGKGPGVDNTQAQPRETEPKEPNPVTDAQRRRSHLMDNKNMKYVFSKDNGVMHDRDCPKVPKIRDRYFEMMRCFSTKMPPCPICYRQAIIRAGIQSDDAKRITAYLNVLNRFHASNDNLYKLIIQNKAKLSDVQLDSVVIKVRQDRWMIRCAENGLELLHNNYAVLEEDKRYIFGGYHVQNVPGAHTFGHFVNIMCTYVWKRHTSKPTNVATVNREDAHDPYAEVSPADMITP